jgi:C4-dicarboxylate-specific signal transduction histidine kinase
MLFVVFLGSYFLTRLYRNKALKKLTHDLNSPLAVLHVLTEENQQPINHDGKHLLRQATQQIKRLIEE